MLWAEQGLPGLVSNPAPDDTVRLTRCSPNHRAELLPALSTDRIWNWPLECHRAVSCTAPSSCSWLRRTQSTIKWMLLLLTLCLPPCCPAKILIWCDSDSGRSLIPCLMIDLSRCDQEINQKISHLHSYCWKESQMSQIKFVSTSQPVLHWWGGSLGFFGRWFSVLKLLCPVQNEDFWSLHI